MIHRTFFTIFSTEFNILYTLSKYFYCLLGNISRAIIIPQFSIIMIIKRRSSNKILKREFSLKNLLSTYCSDQSINVNSLNIIRIYLGWGMLISIFHLISGKLRCLPSHLKSALISENLLIMFLLFIVRDLSACSPFLSCYVILCICLELF